MSEILRIDEEFKNLIPPLADDEYKGLEASIIAEGCRDSIVTWQGIVIDGHNRFEICTKHGIQYNTISKDFESRDDVVMWIIRNQFGRRNLSGYERSKLALRLEPLLKAEAKKRQSGGQGGVLLVQNSAQAIDTRKTRDELAAIAGVSHDTIEKVKFIEKNATRETKSDLSSGKISVNNAYKKSRPDSDNVFIKPRIEATLDNSDEEYKKRLAFNREEKARLLAERKEIITVIRSKVRFLLKRVPEPERDTEILAIVEWLNSLLGGGKA